jgi:alpha-galactosidase
MAEEQERSLALTRGWGERVFAVPGSQPTASRLVVVHDDEAGTTKLNLCAAGTPLRLGSKTYRRGIGVNSNCTLRVELAQPAARLLGEIGVDRNVDNSPASLRFHVRTTDRELFATDVLRPDGRVLPLDLDLGGASVFDLVVSDGGDGRGWDQGDWADARVVLADGSELWLDELATVPVLGAGLPYSFRYGGVGSAELLPGWRHTVAESRPEPDRLLRVVTSLDPETGLEVRAEATIYLDAPGVDWCLFFTNRGPEDLPVLEDLRTLDVRIVPAGLGRGSPVLHRLTGSVAGRSDWLPMSDTLRAGERIAFEPVNGRSSAGACPFFHTTWEGGGVVTAVEDASGTVHLTAGLRDLRLSLRPGETVRGPRILQVYHAETDRHVPCNLFRRTMLAHIVPRPGGAPATPPIAYLSTAFYEMDRGTEADVLAHLEAAVGLGFEYFWLDAYYGRDDFPAIGNYLLPLERSVNPERFPDGLRPIGEAVHRAGLKFLLWMEPERVTPGTLMAVEHPEWVVMPGDGGWGMVDLGNPEARAYVTRFITTAIREYGVDCLRIDNAVNYDALWRLQDARAGGDRIGLAEIRYVEGLYRLWDDLLARFPGLLIDNCASGGQRIDLETCSRSIPLWRTDGTIEPLLQHDYAEAALRNQVMTAGLSRYVPFSASGQSGTEPYEFRSGLNAGISFCEDVRSPGFPRERLRAAAAEALRLRPYFLGDLYPLVDVTTRSDDWCILQYHRAADDDGMVMAFRRPDSRFTGFSLMGLQGVAPRALYELTVSHDYEPDGPARTLTGNQLLAESILIPTAPGSVIVEYRRLPERSAP